GQVLARRRFAVAGRRVGARSAGARSGREGHPGRKIVKRASAFAALALALACGGGQTRLGAVFSTDWRDEGGAAVRAIQGAVLATPIPKNAAVAVGVTDAGLAGIALTGGAPWSYDHAIDARPVVAGTVVVGAGGGELFALDAATGKPLWVRR